MYNKMCSMQSWFLIRLKFSNISRFSGKCNSWIESSKLLISRAFICRLRIRLKYFIVIFSMPLRDWSILRKFSSFFRSRTQQRTTSFRNLNTFQGEKFFEFSLLHPLAHKWQLSHTTFISLTEHRSCNLLCLTLFSNGMNLHRCI